MKVQPTTKELIAMLYERLPELFERAAPVQESVALQMDVIVVNLVREGINKHRARELAEHFIKHTAPPAAQEDIQRLSALVRAQQITIEKLEQALAEPVQEPVAFKIYKPTPPRGAIPDVRDAELPWVYDQDPSSGNVASMWVMPVKATPPAAQREWVGLTDREMVDAIQHLYQGRAIAELAAKVSMDDFRAIEAKLKEKNA